jgi:hypothetical protein
MYHVHGELISHGEAMLGQVNIIIRTLMSDTLQFARPPHWTRAFQGTAPNTESLKIEGPDPFLTCSRCAVLAVAPWHLYMYISIIGGGQMQMTGMVHTSRLKLV